MGTGQNCTMPKLHEGTKLGDTFARVTILHGGSFLHESKKKNRRKDKNIKTKKLNEKKYLPRVRVRGNSDSRNKNKIITNRSYY